MRFALLPILLARFTLALCLPVRAGEAPSLVLPLDCRLGETCFVQNHLDIDHGPGALDFACGSLTYDGHDGTDFRIRDLAAMAEGVIVRAAAPGRIASARDGVADRDPQAAETLEFSGPACGNGVVIDHGGGWQTQYCHLRTCSLAVIVGEQVRAGQPIGFVGLSGHSAFPHLHFAVHHQGRPVDPFLGPGRPNSCTIARRPLWHPDVAHSLTYRASGVLNAGFTAEPPSLGDVETGRAAARAPDRRSDLVLYVRIIGLQPGDRLMLRIVGPDGGAVAERAFRPAERAMAQWLQFLGRRAPAGGWPRGGYRGEFRLLRAGAVALEAVRRIALE